VPAGEVFTIEKRDGLGLHHEGDGGRGEKQNRGLVHVQEKPCAGAAGQCESEADLREWVVANASAWKAKHRPFSASTATNPNRKPR